MSLYCEFCNLLKNPTCLRENAPTFPSVVFSIAHLHVLIFRNADGERLAEYTAL